MLNTCHKRSNICLLHYMRNNIVHLFDWVPSFKTSSCMLSLNSMGLLSHFCMINLLNRTLYRLDITGINLCLLQCMEGNKSIFHFDNIHLDRGISYHILKSLGYKLFQYRTVRNCFQLENNLKDMSIFRWYLFDQ